MRYMGPICGRRPKAQLANPRSHVVCTFWGGSAYKMVPVFLLLALQLATETTCNLNNCELAAISMLWMLGTGNFASSQGLGVAA